MSHVEKEQKYVSSHINSKSRAESARRHFALMYEFLCEKDFFSMSSDDPQAHGILFPGISFKSRDILRESRDILRESRDMTRQ